MTTDFHDICTALRAQASRGRKLKTLRECFAPLGAADRRALAALLTRRTPVVPSDLAARRPLGNAGTGRLSIREAFDACEALARVRAPDERLRRLGRVLERLEPGVGQDFLYLVTGSLSVGTSASLVDEALSGGEGASSERALRAWCVLVGAGGGRGAFAVRGPEGLVEVAQASLPQEPGLSDIIENLVVERLDARLILRPELVFELAFDAVHRDARWASGFVLRQAEVSAWCRERHPFDADTTERIVELYEASRALAEPRLSAPPPVRNVGVDDLPLFGKTKFRAD